jgi:ferric-dicitrate binding protein FerR (iron transport regulator)
MLNPHEHLILKHLQGTLSSEERIAFEAWLSASEDHQKLVADFQNIWQISDAHKQRHIDFDSDTEWKKLEAAVNEESTLTVSIRPRRYIQIAAAIVLLAVASFSLYFIAFRTSQIIERTLSETKKVILPDGSAITLNKNSMLKYESDFENDRDITLEGEGFFEVKPDAIHPFVIHTKETEVAVLGTSFNVRSYKEESSTGVFVVTGKVRFSTADQQKEMILLPGNNGLFNIKDHTLTMLPETDLNVMAWKDKRLIFKKTPLHEVIKTLRNYFNVDIQITNEKLLRCRFTSSFEDPTLQEVLETISLALNLKIDHQSETYSLDGEGCNIN